MSRRLAIRARTIRAAFERSNEREAQRSYSRTDDYSRSDAQPNSRETERSYARTEVREPARDYSRSNEYERSYAQPYARESDSKLFSDIGLYAQCGSD